MKCAWAQELNSRQVLFECGHGRYWYLGGLGTSLGSIHVPF